MRLITWNVNGWKSVVRKGVFENLLRNRSPDVICLQEMKISSESEVHEVKWLKELGYEFYVHTERPGYSGTSIMIRRELWNKVESVEFYGIEGRAIIVRFDKTCLINVYTPNSGVQGLARLNFRVNQWDKEFRELVKREMTTRRVVVVGDLNVARTELDVHNAQNKKRSAGYTDQERESFEKLLKETTLVDVWRELHPSERKYTYWSYLSKARDRDAGWRIDYILTSKELLTSASGKISSNISVSCDVLSNILGSDHAPVEINGLKIE